MNLILDRTIYTSVEKPAIIERNKDHTYAYRYDLKEEAKKDTEDEMTSEIEGTKYSYVSVLLKGYPNRNETIKYLLRKLVSLEDELKLVNDYNEAVKFEDFDSEEYKSYIDYLTLRKTIKTKVKEDFKNAGY